MSALTSEVNVYRIPNEVSYLQRLLEILDSGFPISNMMIITIHHVLKKALNAEIFSDGWPEFTSVVCIIPSPDFINIVMHTSRKECLLAILQDGHVNMHLADREIRIAVVESSLATYLVDNMKSTDGKPLWTSLFTGSELYLPRSVHNAITNMESLCPPGYILGNLEPQHARFVVSYWNNGTGLNAIDFMGSAIKMFPSSAVFLASNPADPVAWMLYYPHGHMGHWFTIDEHRKKGLGTLVALDLCKKLLSEEYIPGCLSANKVAISALKAIGFIESVHCDVIFSKSSA